MTSKTAREYIKSKIEISHKPIHAWLRSGHMKRETKPVLKAALNNSIRTKLHIYKYQLFHLICH